MEMKIGGNQDARDALARVCEERAVSLTALGVLGGVGNASLTRFVLQRRKISNGTYAKTNNLYISSFIKALDAAGYEVVVRPKEAGSRRERRLRALKDRNASNGSAVAV